VVNRSVTEFVRAQSPSDTWQVVSEGRTYHVQTVLVLDMVALVKVLNLYNVYNNKMMWKCCWCLCLKELLSDMSVGSWPLRTEEDWAQKERLFTTTVHYPAVRRR
jgi:hypothetical protein